MVSIPLFLSRRIMGNTEETVETSFKDRVIETAVSCALLYRQNLVEYDYLVCSDAFGESKCQEIKAEANNYLHLLGVNTSLSPTDFYQKCLNKTLEENDFDFVKKGQSEQSVKGSVRQKIKALPKMVNMFEQNLVAEKNFKKNKISCMFATADSDFTIGFVGTGRPKSLMRKNQLDESKQKPVELVMRKKRTDRIYTERIVGDDEDFCKYKEAIKKYIEE